VFCLAARKFLERLLLEMLVLVLVLRNPQPPVSNVLTGGCGMLDVGLMLRPDSIA